MNARNFFAELKRRNVYKVAVAYAVVGWLVIQVSSTVLPAFHAPEWVVQTLIVLLAIGFPIALVIAWAFELTPEGLKRAEDVDALLATNVGVAPPARPKSHAWIYVVAIGAVLSIGLFLLGRYTARSDAVSRSTSEELRRDKQSSSIPQKSIAVLPFENLSDEKANAYFAEGIQNEILTRLASVRDLKVISRTSTAKYQSKPDNLKTVAQDLGVSTVLEGAVQKAGEIVRVNVQLINTHSDTHLWAKSYDREVKDVLGVESEVAEEIAEALRANLSPNESHALAAVRTPDTEAYDLFLRGEYELRQAENSRTAEAYDRADVFYRQALARDPNFAEAAAELTRSRLSRHWFVSP